MARTRATSESLAELLDQSARPIYAIDAQRRIVYGNAALAAWLDMAPERVMGRHVEYHSEATGGDATARESVGPLADLCPPPRALAGEACVGTISCVTRDGGLAHRHAEFVPLAAPPSDNRQAGGVLVLLAAHDLSPQELATELSREPTADELHQTIRRFRRVLAGQYAIESLLGDSSTMRKVRSQVAAAATSGANALIVGRSGSGRSHVARAIHYRAGGGGAVKLLPIDCRVVTEDLLRRALDALREPGGDARQRPTLLLENLEGLPASHQSQLWAAMRQNALPARVVATAQSSRHTPCAIADVADVVDNSAAKDVDDPADGTRSVSTTADLRPATLDPALLDAVSTITIRVPRLADRLEDLPILAQCFLETCNRGSGKQIGSLRPEAIDLLTLYRWPGELAELRATIAAAHRACASHEITPADLPAVIHHATQSAARVRRQPERIVLDELLAAIEKEAVARALAQSGGNKTEAAELLGMTRPRLYRRLVQLRLAGDGPPAPERQGPEFIEREPMEPTP